ncbi:uncharacterized protein LOC134209873 isoform X2 [Armigeres subalbatus]|uniref:uncharacterized protein LOC134209873 isoform X2 n=1 Tax=Armigeres subalbatus TaxID=124917 RepID=UPI002ED1A84C
MDEYVENILKKWNLADLVHRFREEEVNEEAFLLLTPDIIKELIPKLGKRAIFTARFNELKQPPQVHNEPIVQDTIDLLITQDNTKQTTHFIEQGPSVSSEFQSVSHITGSTNDCDSPTAKRVGVSSEPTKTHLDEQRPSTSEFVSLSHAPASTSDGETPCAKRIKLESDVFDEFSDSILLEDSSQDSTALLEDENENMDKTLKDPKVPGVEKLRLLLQQSPFARYLLGLNELDRFHRIDITNFVTQYIYNSNPNERIKHAEFKYWAEAIVNLFPSENQLITSDAAIEFYTARLTTRYNYMMKIKKDAKGPVFESASPSRRGKNVGRKESKDEAELQVVEELRRIVGSCFVMRDTLNSRSLTPYQRNVLAAYIVNYLMDKNGGPISIRELELYARAIEQVFPNENASIYFRRKGNCANVNGKLYDRYGYMKRKRSMAQGKPYSDFLDGSTPIGRLREIKTVEEARALWNETHNARKEVTRKVVPIKLFEQYPFLTQPDGYTLFTDDFDQDHPNSIDTFKRYWPDFASAIYRYIEENRVLKGVTEFNTEDYQDDILTSCLILMPLLFKLMVRNKKYWNPTRMDVCHNFIIYATDFKQIVEILKQREELLTRCELRINPVVVAIGPTIANIESSYIVVESVYYPMESLQDAVETCVKVCTAMNLRYLDEVASPWMMVQRFVMKLELPKDVISTKVFAVLENLGLPMR